MRFARGRGISIHAEEDPHPPVLEPHAAPLRELRQPGFVETDMWTMVSRDQGALLGMTAEEFTRQRAAQVPLGRMEKPEDVATAVSPPWVGLRPSDGNDTQLQPAV